MELISLLFVLKNKENLLWKNVGANCVRPLEQLPLSKIGIVVENEIHKLNTIYENIKVDKYQIMPNHIHFIIFIYEDSNLNNYKLQY